MLIRRVPRFVNDIYKLIEPPWRATGVTSQLNQKILSNDRRTLKNHYECIVIGSGYGGAVAAARMAEAGIEVCILERGKEYAGKDFPRNLNSAVFRHVNINRQVRVDRLFDVRKFRDAHIICSSGLGGGSLVNAAVAVEPDPELWKDQAWPGELRDDVEVGLKAGFERAKSMLGVNPYPDREGQRPTLAKSAFFDAVAPQIGAQLHEPDLAINFGPAGPNALGREQGSCVGCGSCIAGCPVQAKNSLDLNYLAFAKKQGAQIFTQMEVAYVRKLGPELYGVVYRRVDEARDLQRTHMITCTRLVLAAGSLGSSEILLRSREMGDLSVSQQLGQRFSLNGGYFAWLFAADENADFSSFGWTEQEWQKYEKTGTIARQTGPTITRMLAFKNGKDRVVLEDCTSPGLFGRMTGLNATLFALLGQEGGELPLRKIGSVLRGLVGRPLSGAVAKTLFTLGVATDGSRGRLHLESRKGEGPFALEVALDWPGLDMEDHYESVRSAVKKVQGISGGIFGDSRSMGSRLPLSVHPLGGCSMGDDAERGVVDHACRLFDPATGGVHSGFYVCDASVLSASVGSNPLLTIAGLSERAMALALSPSQIRRKGATGFDVGSQGIEPGESLVFEEELQGFVSPAETDCAMGYRKGQAMARPVHVIFSHLVDDMDRFTSDPERRARIVNGWITAPWLSVQPLSMENGSYYNFVQDPDRKASFSFRLSCLTRLAGGRVLRWEGRKSILRERVAYAYRDLTVMDVKVYENDSLLFVGQIKVSFAGMMKNAIMRMRSYGGEGEKASVVTKAKFLHHFLGNTARAYLAEPVKALGQRKPLPSQIQRHTLRGVRDATVTVYPLVTADGLQLQLTACRRSQPSRGAVFLVHGLSTSSDMYIMPEHENLTNHLLDQGYEVWLFDNRQSCRFDYNAREHDWSFDTVAALDYPPALALVRSHVGSEHPLYVIAHCIGAMTFSMALAQQLIPPVDGLVTNAVSLAVEVPPVSRLKLKALLESRLIDEGLGITLLDPKAYAQSSLKMRAIQRLVSATHPECDSPVCHMLSFMWGAGNPGLFLHQNISDVTHERLGDLFGPLTLQYFKHIVEAVNHGRVMEFSGRVRPATEPIDYLELAKDLRVPQLYIQGAQNHVFADSQKKAYYTLNRQNYVDQHLKIYQDYGHQDIFMGRFARRDIFGDISNFLNAIPLQRVWSERTTENLL